MAAILDQDGDGIDDRIAAHADRVNPGWRSDPADLQRMQETQANPASFQEYLDNIQYWDDHARNPEALAYDEARTLRETAAAIPTREAMTYTPTGYDPTLVDRSEAAHAQSDGRARAAQEIALRQMLDGMNRPDLAARAGLDQAQLDAAGGGPGSRAAMAQAALGAGRASGDTYLRGASNLGVAGTERRSQAANEALSRAAAEDQRNIANARATNAARAYGAGEQTAASISNATIPSRQLGLAARFTDLARGQYDRAEARSLQAQEDAAQRTRDLVSGGTGAGVALAQGVIRATADDEEEKSGRGTYGGRK